MAFPNSQSNPASAVPVWLAPAPAAAGLTVTNITTNTGTQIKTGAGTFLGLSVNTVGNGSTAAIYDGTSTSGTLLGTISTAAQGVIFPPGGWPFSIGLFIETAGSEAANITISNF